MPYRPHPKFRKDIQGFILPLTAAVGRLYKRNIDGAYPLGAFYTENIDSRVWIPAGGIWYQPISPERISARRIAEERIQRFIAGVTTATQIQLSNGTIIIWEPVPENIAQQLHTVY